MSPRRPLLDPEQAGLAIVTAVVLAGGLAAVVWALLAR
jgi:hypothetical protein